MLAVNITIVFLSKHLIAYFLLKLAVRDNCMNKTIMKKEIKPVFTVNKTLDFTWSVLSILVDDTKENIN